MGRLSEVDEEFLDLVDLAGGKPADGTDDYREDGCEWPWCPWDSQREGQHDADDSAEAGASDSGEAAESPELILNREPDRRFFNHASPLALIVKDCRRGDLSAGDELRPAGRPRWASSRTASWRGWCAPEAASSPIGGASTPWRFLDGDVRTTDPRMLFEAGRVAALRGWSSPQVVDVASVLDQGPNGAPLIILASPDALTAKSARAIAALLGAGRDAVILSSGVSVEAVTGWLPEGSLICVDQSDRDPRDAGAALEPSLTQPYCELRHEPLQWSQDPDALRPASYFWDAFREDCPFRMQEGRQSGPQSEWFAHRPIDEGADPVVLRLVPAASETGPCVVVESAVGRTRHALDDAWRLGFANMVLAFTELPDGHTRLGRGIKDPLTLADLRMSVDSVWKDVPAATRPERVLRAVPASEAGTESVVSLTYVVPVTENFAATRASLLRCADSLVRVRRMILDPATQLEGRRNPAAGLKLVQLMNAVDLVPV